MTARLPPRGSSLPSNVQECLHMLSSIIQKYNDQDPEDVPQEVDYLQAMDLLKRINDIGCSTAMQSTQVRTINTVVVQWRERQTNHRERQTQQLKSEQMKQYITCEICGHFVKDGYAYTRHKKRLSCIRVSIIRKMPAKVRNLIHNLNTKMLAKEERDDHYLAYFISEAFLVELSLIHLNAQPKIRRPQGPDGRIPLLNKHPFPQRLIPERLWNSLWDPRGYFLDDKMTVPRDPRRMLVYDPSMFFGKIYVKHDMFRRSLVVSPTTLEAPKPAVWSTLVMQSWIGEGRWAFNALRMSIDVYQESDDD